MRECSDDRLRGGYPSTDYVKRGRMEKFPEVLNEGEIGEEEENAADDKGSWSPSKEIKHRDA